MKKESNNSKGFFASLAGLVLLFNGCIIYTNISSRSDKRVNFSKYHTFNWSLDQKDTCDSDCGGPDIRKMEMDYFKDEFEKRGYRLDVEKPELLLRLRICNIKRWEPDVNYPSPWGSFHTVYLFPPAYVVPQRTYLESTVTLWVLDVKQNRVVWSSAAQGDIHDFGCTEGIMQQAVKAIMGTYPVKPLKSLLRSTAVQQAATS